MEVHSFSYAFLLTLVAGLATGIGSLIAFFAKQTSTRFLSFCLGFSAGVMIYISFMDILPKAMQSFLVFYSEHQSQLYLLFSFFFGILLIAAIDHLIPHQDNPHEEMRVEKLSLVPQKKLYRTGMMTALAIAIHNFPEGMATFFTAYQDPQAGLAIAFAIALHNIPEGIAVSIPLYYSTGSRQKAFTFSFLSGLSEPLGALLGYWLLMPLLNSAFYGSIFAAVAGIMVFISLDQLLPAAREYGEHHLAIYGLILGMFVMGISLVLLI